MNTSLDKKIERAWKYTWDKMYCKKTKLLYDYVTENGSTGCLPTIEEIKACCPNPCGWNTGMENGALNGGSFLEGIISRYSVTKEPELLQQATDIYEGLKTLATVSNQRGFLARSVSPIDGKSHYINSSRDQYTHTIYAFLLYWKSEMSSEKQKKEIVDMLVSFAKKAEHDVVKENDYCLLREDNKPALVCKMLDEDHKSVYIHEVHRLPMFYMAAWVVSKNKHWWKKYVTYRDWALDFAETLNDECLKRFEWCNLFLQMQYSLRVLYDYETEENYKTRYGKLMQKIISYMPFYTKKTEKIINDINYREPIADWRKVPAQFFWDLCCSYEKAVYFPLINNEENIVHKTLRNHAEAMIIYANTPNVVIPKEEIEFFEKLIKKLDFDKSVSYWPLLYACAWWVMRANIKE